MKNPTPSPPRLRLASPADILAVVPHLLGFHPASSLVVIGAGGARDRVRLSCRYDLPDPPDAAAAAQIAEHVRHMLGRERLTTAIVVGYGPGRLVTPLTDVLAPALRRDGLTLREMIRAEHGRYWSYLCTEPGCCPPEGVPFDIGCHPVAAAMTVAGLGVYPDRAALARSLDPVTGKAAELMKAAISRACERAAALVAEAAGSGAPRPGGSRSGGTRPGEGGHGQGAPGAPVLGPGEAPAAPRPPAGGSPAGPSGPAGPGSCRGDGGPGQIRPGRDGRRAAPARRGADPGRAGPGGALRLVVAEGRQAVREAIAAYRAGSAVTDDQLAWLAVTLTDLRVRDDAWARMEPAHQEAHLRLWTDLVRRVDPAYAPAPAALLAFVAWQSGNGALAGIAIGRALAADPGYSLALLLRDIVEAGVPPSEARPPMTPEEVEQSYETAGQQPSPPPPGAASGRTVRGGAGQGEGRPPAGR